MAVEWPEARGYSANMLSRRFLTEFVLLFCCAAPAFAQLPKRLERCLPNPTLAQEIRDMQQEVLLKQPPEPQVYVHVVRVEFDSDSGIPKVIQKEISKKEEGRTWKMETDSDYMKDVANESAEVAVRGALQDAGYFRVLTEAKLTVLKRDGAKIDVVEHVSAEVGDQYRLGKIRFESTDPEKQPSYRFESLRETIPLKRGDIFSVGALREGLKKLTSMYGEDGYIDFTAEPEFDINDESKVIDVTFRLDLQKQYRIREIEFWGVNPMVEQRLRASYQQSGEVFNKRTLEQFLQESKTYIPEDVEPDEVVSIHRDTSGGVIGIVFDFRTCPGTSNYVPPTS